MKTPGIELRTLALLAAVFFLQLVTPGVFAGENPLQGKWQFTTVGTSGLHGQTAEGLSQKFSLVFDEKAGITGKVFGKDIDHSHTPETTPNASFSFTTHYKIGDRPFSISWHGKLSGDGTEITDGKFSFIMGAGTFTAKKQ